MTGRTKETTVTVTRDASSTLVLEKAGAGTGGMLFVMAISNIAGMRNFLSQEEWHSL